MLRAVTIIHWNGRDLPEELRALPAGDYVVKGTGEALGLSVDEEEGMRAAMRSLAAGHGVAHEAVRARVLRHIRT
jgi:hypothetical protein